jgi:hypothetical protein
VFTWCIRTPWNATNKGGKLKCLTVCQMCKAHSAVRVEGGSRLTFVLFQRPPAEIPVR